MGSATPLILRASVPAYGHIVVEASDGFRYHADLSSFSRVHCYPKTPAEWSSVSPDSHGLALIWASRFEVHVNQVIALAHQREALERTA